MANFVLNDWAADYELSEETLTILDTTSLPYFGQRPIVGQWLRRANLGIRWFEIKKIGET